MNVNMLRKIIILITILHFIAEKSVCLATNFAADSSYDTCFTPGEDCSNKIIRAIAQAKQEILVQAYSFSDISIAEALVLAKTIGIDVKIILDKSQLRARYSLIPYFINHNIKLVIDNEPKIAHNKILVLDRQTVVGGSYNFTQAAKNKNAENVMIINDPGFAEKYVKYWYKRQTKSKEISMLKTNSRFKQTKIYGKNNPN